MRERVDPSSCDSHAPLAEILASLRHTSPVTHPTPSHDEQPIDVRSVRMHALDVALWTPRQSSRRSVVQEWRGERWRWRATDRIDVDHDAVDRVLPAIRYAPLPSVALFWHHRYAPLQPHAAVYVVTLASDACAVRRAVTYASDAVRRERNATQRGDDTADEHAYGDDQCLPMITTNASPSLPSSVG